MLKLILLVVYFVVATFVGCSSSDSPTLIDSRTRGSEADHEWRLVEAVSLKLVTPKMNSIVKSSRELKKLVQNTCSGSEIKIDRMQNLWASMMYDYHYLDGVTFGPLTSYQESSPLRFIYSNPPSNAPQYIEREITKAFNQKENYKMPRPLAHSMGLSAIEYLLFSERSDNLILSPESGECYYFLWILNDLESRLTDYRQQWQDTEVNFINSPEGKTRLKEVISRLASHIIVYTDKILKDRKLGAPLGLQSELYPCNNELECTQTYLEHPFYPDQKIAFVAPLKALSDIFNGRLDPDQKVRTYGFNDYLISLNPSNKDNPSVQLSNILKSVEGLPAGEVFKAAFKVSKNDLTNNPMFILLQNIRVITTWMKTDYLIELNSSLPEPAQGDTD